MIVLLCTQGRESYRSRGRAASLPHHLFLEGQLAPCVPTDARGGRGVTPFVPGNDRLALHIQQAAC